MPFTHSAPSLTKMPASREEMGPQGYAEGHGAKRRSPSHTGFPFSHFIHIFCHICVLLSFSLTSYPHDLLPFSRSFIIIILYVCLHTHTCMCSPTSQLFIPPSQLSLLVILQIFIANITCARHCPGHWSFRSEQSEHDFYPPVVTDFIFK